MMRGVRGLASPMVTALPRMSPMVTRPRMMSSGPREEADIVIAGGGMVGCSAAVALANLGEKYKTLPSVKCCVLKSLMNLLCQVA